MMFINMEEIKFSQIFRRKRILKVLKNWKENTLSELLKSTKWIRWVQLINKNDTNWNPVFSDSRTFLKSVSATFDFLFIQTTSYLIIAPCNKIFFSIRQLFSVEQSWTAIILSDISVSTVVVRNLGPRANFPAFAFTPTENHMKETKI